MNADDAHNQTRLELFCLFVEEKLSSSSSASSPSALAALLESHFEHVWSEFSTLCSSSCNSISSDNNKKNNNNPNSQSSSSSSKLMNEYSNLICEATCTMFEIVFSNDNAKEQDGTRRSDIPAKVVTNDASFLRICRALLSFFSLSELYLPSLFGVAVPSSSRALRYRSKLIETLIINNGADSTSRSNNTTTTTSSSSSDVTIFQKQVALSSNSTVSENFRLPGTVFDPRRALTEVGDILDNCVWPRFKDDDDSSTTVSKQQKEPQTSSSTQSYNYHIKSILPFTNEGSRLMYDQIPMWCDKVESIFVMNGDDDYERNDKNHKGNNSTKKSSSAALSSSLMIPQLAHSLEQLLSDMTNLLYRASAQTPQNSPNCAFLAFLVSDVSVHLAPIFNLSLQRQQQEQQEQEDALRKRGERDCFFLFSPRIIPRHLFSASGGQQQQKQDEQYNIRNENNNNNNNTLMSNYYYHSINSDLDSTFCTKFEVALGCAIDCLYGDIEATIAECCNRLENENFGDDDDLQKSKHAFVKRIATLASSTSSSSSSPAVATTATNNNSKNNDDNSTMTIDYGSMCSSGMLQLLTSVVHPILCVFRHHSHSDENSSKNNNRNDICRDILKYTLRMICSYWNRQRSSSSRAGGVIFNLVFKYDIEVLFKFCKMSLLGSDQQRKGNATTLSLVKVVEWFEVRNQ